MVYGLLSDAFTNNYC